jgi:hypothetical protein
MCRVGQLWTGLRRVRQLWVKTVRDSLPRADQPAQQPEASNDIH